METTIMNRKNYGWLHGVALSLLTYSLAACSLPASPPPRDITPGAVRSAVQPPIRAIIYFQRPTADSKPLTAAISEACRCQLVFFRPYLGDALIYEIALQQGENFASFEKALMQHADQLGIKIVEQDSIMQHQ